MSRVPPTHSPNYFRSVEEFPALNWTAVLKWSALLAWAVALGMVALSAAAAEGQGITITDTDCCTLAVETTAATWDHHDNETTDLIPLIPDPRDAEAAWLEDGKMVVERVGGMYCNSYVNCAVVHEEPYNHCTPYREVYGIKGGEIVLLKTIHPKITEAKARQIEWPEEEE